MYPSEGKDLTGSVLIYMAAILFGLAVFGVPFYLATRPTVIDNPGMGALERTADQNLAAHASHKVFPVAHLKQKPIVSAATLARVNAEAEKADEAHHAPAQYARRAYEPRRAPVHAESAANQHPGFFRLFSTLF